MGRNGRKQKTIDMTELIWEGKYRDGKKVAPVRIALPFQTVETVNVNRLCDDISSKPHAAIEWE